MFKIDLLLPNCHPCNALYFGTNMTVIYTSGSTGNNVRAVGWIVSSKVPYRSWCCTWDVLGIRTNLPFWGIIFRTKLAPTGTGAVHTHSSNLVICLVSALCLKCKRSNTRNPSHDNFFWPEAETWDLQNMRWRIYSLKCDSPNVFYYTQWRTEWGGGWWWCSNPPPEIPKFWQSWAECPVPWKIHP